MMTDEERVARAICYANCLAAHPGDIGRATCQADNGWDMWLNEARAAIEERAAQVAAIIDPAAFWKRVFPSWDYEMEKRKSAALDKARAIVALEPLPAPPSAATDPGIPVYRLRDGTEDVLGEG